MKERPLTGQDAACTVIVTVDAPPELVETVIAHARLGLERFGDFPGFLGGVLFESGDGRLVQYVSWTTEDEYRACVDNPSWDDLPSTRAFMGAVESGAVIMDARVFKLVAAVP